MCNIDNLITNNQTNMPLEVLKALLSGDTKNEGTKQETRVSEQSRAASRLVHAHQPKGVSHFVNQIGRGDTTLFSRQQGNYLLLSLKVGVSHEVESSQYANGVITIQRP